MVKKKTYSKQFQKARKLEEKKEFLHKMIDNITEADYVEANSRLVDVAGKTQQIHQIMIEKNGNIKIFSKEYPHNLDFE